MISNTLKRQSTSSPWYKVGMVWFAFGLPAIVVVASLITVVIAHQNAPLIVPKQLESQAEH